MSEAEVNAIVGERCEKILLDVAEILGVKSPEEVLEAVQQLASNQWLESLRRTQERRSLAEPRSGIIDKQARLECLLALENWETAGYPGTKGGERW